MARISKDFMLLAAAPKRLVAVNIVLHYCSTMKTTTIRELRNNYAKVLRWVSAGEEVRVTRHGKIVARVVPPPPVSSRKLDWKESAAFNRPHWPHRLSAVDSAAVLAESQGA
jgi:prevent-host-death family protein